MKNKIVTFSVLIFMLYLNSYANPITCPIRPGYFDCSSKTIKVDTLTPEWQVKTERNSHIYCSNNENSYFKLMEASHNNHASTLTCLYAAINDDNQILAFLSLTSQNYVADKDAMYSHWGYMQSGFDCGHVFGTSIYNCPIKLK